MSCPEKNYAQVGDTIEIVYKETPLFGLHFVVLPRPEGQKCTSMVGDAWIFDCDEERHRVLEPEYYKIIRRADSPDTKSVDVSLEKQRDDNLRKVFG